jgi:hypothetical protein
LVSLAYGQKRKVKEIKKLINKKACKIILVFDIQASLLFINFLSFTFLFLMLMATKPIDSGTESSRWCEAVLRSIVWSQPCSLQSLEKTGLRPTRSRVRVTNGLQALASGSVFSKLKGTWASEAFKAVVSLALDSFSFFGPRVLAGRRPETSSRKELDQRRKNPTMDDAPQGPSTSSMHLDVDPNQDLNFLSMAWRPSRDQEQLSRDMERMKFRSWKGCRGGPGGHGQ